MANKCTHAPAAPLDYTAIDSLLNNLIENQKIDQINTKLKSRARSRPCIRAPLDAFKYEKAKIERSNENENSVILVLRPNS